MIPGLKPATWGCSHGVGFLGNAIRDAQLEMSGDRTASWAGHCFVYIGKYNFGSESVPRVFDAIVEAEYPKVVISRADRHSDAIWAINQPLSDKQRQTGVETAMRSVGKPYHWQAYLYFGLRLLKVKMSKDLAPLLGDPRLGPICSGIVVRVQETMGVNLGPLRTAAIEDPDFVSPADCLRWGLDRKWMSRTPIW